MGYITQTLLGLRAYYYLNNCQNAYDACFVKNQCIFHAVYINCIVYILYVDIVKYETISKNTLYMETLLPCFVPTSHGIYLLEMLEHWARQLGSPVPIEFLRHRPMLHDCSDRNASLVFFQFFLFCICIWACPGLLGFRTIDDIECTLKSVHYGLIKWRCFVVLELVSAFKTYFNEQNTISDIKKIIPRINSLCVHEIPVQFSD